MEEAPELTEEDDQILDRIWAQVVKEETGAKDPGQDPGQ
jgi:hypothetical protein